MRQQGSIIDFKKLAVACVGVILAISVVFVGMLGISQASQSSLEVPKLVSATAYDIGSIGYAMAGYVAEGIRTKYGTKVRIIPAGNDISRLLPVTLGNADFSFMGAAAMLQLRGMEDFASREWGPQDLRSVFLSQNFTGNCIFARGDSGIRTPWDVKGKKVASVVGAPAINLTMESMLAYANLTWDDVTAVKFTSNGGAATGVIEGTCDVANFGCTTTFALKLEASPHGAQPLHFPNVTSDDKKAWARLQKVAPFMFPYDCPIAISGHRDLTKGMVTNHGQIYPQQICYASQDEDLIYFWVKALHESYDLWKDSCPWFVNWTVERNMQAFEGLSITGVLPFHKGAIRYFKEIGLWTAALESKNNEALDRVKKLKVLWKATVGEALEKEIKDKEFPAFWTEKRIAAGL